MVIAPEARGYLQEVHPHIDIFMSLATDTLSVCRMDSTLFSIPVVVQILLIDYISVIILFCFPCR